MSGSARITTDDGAGLEVRIDGPDGAPCVVFSNSVMTDLGIWDRQLAALTDRFRVLRYDQRGHGGSDVTEGELTFDRLGADLLQILDRMEIARVSFVGLSKGVPTGLSALSRAPERFEAFVAVDGVARSAPGREAFWAERRETARARGMAEIAHQTVPRWMPGAAPGDPAALRLDAMIASTPVEGFAAATHALQSYDCSAAVPLIGCPFLGVFGAEDGAMPDAIPAQFGSLPAPAFAAIPGAGHLPNHQCPDDFNRTLRAFLDAETTKTYRETRH